MLIIGDMRILHWRGFCGDSPECFLEQHISFMKRDCVGLSTAGGKTEGRVGGILIHRLESRKLYTTEV